MQLSYAITLHIVRVKPGNQRREGGRDSKNLKGTSLSTGKSAHVIMISDYPAL